VAQAAGWLNFWHCLYDTGSTNLIFWCCLCDTGSTNLNLWYCLYDTGSTNLNFWVRVAQAVQTLTFYIVYVARAVQTWTFDIVCMTQAAQTWTFSIVCMTQAVQTWIFSTVRMTQAARTCLCGTGSRVIELLILSVWHRQQGRWAGRRAWPSWPVDGKAGRRGGYLFRCELLGICRVGQNHTFLGIYGVRRVVLAGKSPYIRSYTVQIYGSGQP